MTVLRALARPIVASIFILQGYDTFRRPERVAPLAEPVVRPLANRVPRLSALAMAGTLVPTTLAGHRFWEASEEEGDRAQSESTSSFLA